MLHGNRTYLLQDDDGQILEGHSISAGLDYPGIGPEHAHLFTTGRAKYVTATDAGSARSLPVDVKAGGASFRRWNRLMPSPRVGDLAKEVGTGGIVVLNLSGRGDKDIFTVAKALGVEAI